MFLKSFITFISAHGAMILMMAAAEVSAQEVVREQGAYERYVLRVPDLPILENGGRADLLIEYFANPQGQVALTNYTAIASVQNNTCKLYFKPNGDICYCANIPPGFQGCVGNNNGPTGGVLQVVDLEVQVVPELNPNGDLLSFSMSIEAIQTQKLGRFKVEGFDTDAVAPQLRLEMMDQ